MSDVIHAARLLAPVGDGSANTTVRYFTATSSSQAHAVPATWAGRYVSMTATGAMVQYFFSTSSAATCDETIAAAADGGGSASLGGTIPQDGERQRRIPARKPNETIYFVRASTGTAQVRMELADDPDEVL